MLQVALSLAVLFSSALFVRSAVAAGRAPLGFDPSSGVVVELDFSLRRTPIVDTQRTLSAAITHARAEPGVIAAAATTLLPYGNNGAAKRIEPASPAARSTLAGENITPHFAAITPGYLETLGVRLLRGRDFTAGETRDPSSAYVAIIDERLAHRLFPKGDPLGQRIREIGRTSYSAIPAAGAAPEYEIVGVCSSHRHELFGDNQSCIYVPLSAIPDHRGSVYLQVRYAASDPAQIDESLAPLRNALLAGDADLPLTLVSPFSALIDRHAPLWLTRAGAVSLSLLGTVAVLLAVIGLYGIKAYAVARRTREIGIRLALGAPPRAAFTLIFRQAFLQIALALAVGSLLALAVGRLLSSFIYQISGTDPIALTTAALLLGLATLAACWLPARRAGKVDPVIALRSE
jgi:predicted permease